MKNNVLDLVNQTLETNNKINKITTKRALYEKELKDIQNNFLIKFNKSKNEDDIKKIQLELNESLIKLNDKFLDKTIKKVEA